MAVAVAAKAAAEAAAAAEGAAADAKEGVIKYTIDIDESHMTSSYSRCTIRLVKIEGGPEMMPEAEAAVADDD